ncbi:hypothetical protein NDU88_010815 [Pleurodeles waltl]|uniref:Uncharacterized protein n=1 Tax=Pleurodeles waltl TaxID=8319 RepID=A0AAV7RZ96_PLEWA|nr:hypothetical protein NDU88_010815 [Pleurodeles waltl]
MSLRSLALFEIPERQALRHGRTHGGFAMSGGGISDHAPLFADWGAEFTTHRPTWRLNAWHLNSPECVSFVGGQLKAFFKHKVGSVVSGVTVWVPCKPTIRGTIKSYIRGQERRQRARCAQIKAAILELEGRAGCSDAPAVQRQLVLARSELCQIMSKLDSVGRHRLGEYMRQAISPAN